MTETNLVRVKVSLIDELKDMKNRDLLTLGDVVRFLKDEYDKTRNEPI